MFPSTASVMALKLERREKCWGRSVRSARMSSALVSATFSMVNRAGFHVYICPGLTTNEEKLSALPSVATSTVPEMQ